jgi:trehalose 6-phosphate synthase/phosphatase
VLVGRINGQFATPTWTPIHYLYRSVPSTVLLALYRAADAMLVTPVRDGMNLVAKEFAASRVDEDGVLVLSEFAGAADELDHTLPINPFYTAGFAEDLRRALEMPLEERRERMAAMKADLRENTIYTWMADFLAAAGQARQASIAGGVA